VTIRKTFKAESLDDALADARLELGDGIKVIAAHRLRRGGVGGFFAREIGVEVEVEAPDASRSTVQDVAGLIERLVSEKSDTLAPTLAVPRTRDTDSILSQKREPLLETPQTAARDWAQKAADRVSDNNTMRPKTSDTVIAVREELRAALEIERTEREREIAARDVSLRLEREKREAALSERDTERRRAIQAESERDDALRVATGLKSEALAELERLANEREEAERRALQARATAARAENERVVAQKREEALREDVREILERDNLETSGQAVLSRLGVPSEILDQVIAGVPLSRAVPKGPLAGDPASEHRLIILAGPSNVIRRRQEELAVRLSVKPSDLAFASTKESLSKRNESMRYLSDPDDIQAWIDARLGDRSGVSILALEYSSGSGYATFLRRTRKAAQRAHWRAVVPASYSAENIGAVWSACGGRGVAVDVMDVSGSNNPAGVLAFAQHIGSVDGEPHSGALWASLLWDIACEM
jgi:flagellar biosynthesis GTPase FlhF